MPMPLNNLTHYTFAQFSVVFVFLIFFIVSSGFGFFSIYYTAYKKQLISLWSIYLLLILWAVLVETAYTLELSYIFSMIFRAFNIILIFLLVWILNSQEKIRVSKKILYSASIVLHLLVIVFSFYFHYLSIYMSAVSSVIFWLLFKPSKLDMLIEKEAPAILKELKEAILIVSPKGKILLMNSPMSELSGFPESPVPSSEEISLSLTGSVNRIDKWIGGEIDSDNIYTIKNKYYQINKTLIQGRGLIITASDVTENVLVQNELEQSINELETLTAKLQNYSLNTESIGVKREREMIYRHIREIIRDGLLWLKEDLLEIRLNPPEDYEYILIKSRQLLNEIREIVSNWRTITGGNY